ncbi:uncharacterized protein LOC136036236 isoform X2 [Artemia franciscana]|uniref:BTB domain-containing protein n=1 Tax=Artemia franciscana TaxID=6661 RepID=A0AA88I590_ARTSF|nr:hypothetical protein QYM36_004346 [Artemia franciscana]
MKPNVIHESLETMTEEDYDKCSGIHNSFSAIQCSAVYERGTLREKELESSSNHLQFDEKVLCYFDMWKTDSFTDVELVCRDGRRVKSHKVYLSAVSKILGSVFLEHEDDGLALIHLPDYEYEDLVNMMLLIYSGVIYNERASIEYLQSLLNELEITIGTTTADDKIGIFDSTGSETELKQKENLKVSSNSFETKVIPAKRELRTRIVRKEVSVSPPHLKARKRDAPQLKTKAKKTKPVQYICRHCPSIFNSEESLNDHEASNSCLNEEELTVKHESFIDDESLEVQKSKTSKPKPVQYIKKPKTPQYLCQNCLCDFFSEEHLNNHLAWNGCLKDDEGEIPVQVKCIWPKNPKPKAAQFLCWNCPTVFFSEIDLTNHQVKCLKDKENEFPVKVECLIDDESETFLENGVRFVNDQSQVIDWPLNETVYDVDKVIQNPNVLDKSDEMLDSESDIQVNPKTHTTKNPVSTYFSDYIYLSTIYASGNTTSRPKAMKRISLLPVQTKLMSSHGNYTQSKDGSNVFLKLRLCNLKRHVCL